MDSSNDELAYLNPDFDLNSLTVPRIRAILVSHDVSYPSSAKKAQLINILEDEVLPKAKKLLRERERVRRTSKGITNMQNSQDSLNGEEEERESMPPPPTPSTTTSLRRGRSRMSTRASTAETEETSPPPPPPSSSRRKTRTPAAKTTKHPRASDTETGDDAANVPGTGRKSTARKSRKSESLLTPRAAQSIEDEETPLPVKNEETSRAGSVFTDDNPFQSGSSPSPFDPPRARTVSRDRRRKTSLRQSSEATPAREERRKRMTEPPPSKLKLEDDVKVPTRSTFEIPVSSLHKAAKDEESSDDEEADMGEEFTPEGQLEMARERAKKGEWDVQPTTQRRRQEKSSSLVANLPWLIVLTLFGLIASWYRKEKIEIGFCGAGKPHWSLAETQVPDWVDMLGPQCEICPQHAYCYPGLEARCEQDFVLKPHPLSLGGLFPLPPTCEPDGEKARRVKAVADKAIEELRERRVKWECGEPSSETGEEVPRPEISESELKEDLGSKRRKGMSEEEFEDLWKGALGEIVGREEVVSKAEG